MSTRGARTRQPSGLWANRNFVTLLTGETVSHLGVQVAQVALPIVAVTYLGATERQTGMVQAAQTAAFLLVGLPAGAWVDRMSKRAVMIWANAARAILLACVPALYLLNHLSMSALVVLALLLGLATVFFDVAYLSLTPAIVTRAQLHAANSYLQTSEMFSRVAGPALAGMLSKLIAAPLLLGAGSLGYIASVAAAWRLRVPSEPSRQGDTKLWAEVREGAAYVFRHPLLSRTAFAVSLWSMFDQMARALMAILLLRNMGISSGSYGLIFTIAAMASLAGPWLANWSTRRFGVGPTLVWSFATAALPPLASFIVADMAAPAVGYAVIMGAFCIGWAAMPVFNITHVTLRQELCPPQLLGRMNATMRFAMWGVMPVGALLGGELGARLGLAHTFALALAGSFLSWLLLATSRVRRVRSAADWLGRDDATGTSTDEGQASDT